MVQLFHRLRIIVSLTFDVNGSQQLSLEYINPRLTTSAGLVEVRLSTTLTEETELFLATKISILSFDSARKIPNNLSVCT